MSNYNKRVENIIDKFDYNDFRNTKDASNLIYDNQIETAIDIVLSFTKFQDDSNEVDFFNRHTILYAQMQSGKTGVCSALINILNKTKLNNYFNIERYILVTGMNDKGLQIQTKNRIVSQVNDITESMVNTDVKKENKNHLITIYKNSELKDSKFDLKNTLIIIDESHYGTDKSINVLNKFFQKNGINWKNDESLSKNNVYILSVSATPFNELVSDIKDSKNKVFLPTESNYLGVKDFNDLGLLYKANGTEKEINSFIEDAYQRMTADNRKGALFIRTRHNLKIDHTIWDVEYLDSKLEQINYKYISSRIDNLIYSPNSKPLLIFIKGAYRAGITIDINHKSYIYGVYDYSVKREATLQGLLGRLCGYRSDNFINTKFYINLDHIQDYLAFIKGDKEYDRKLKGNLLKIVLLDKESIPIDSELDVNEDGVKDKEQLLKWVNERRKNQYKIDTVSYSIGSNFKINTGCDGEYKTFDEYYNSALRQARRIVDESKRKKLINDIINLNKILVNIIYYIPTNTIELIYNKVIENKKQIVIGKLIDIKKT